MKRKLPLLFVVCTLAFAGAASALETDDLIAITAMPLAVADVVALPDVPQNDVVTVVTTLNRAAVPAPQFIEIVRYSPVAFVQPAEPRFVTYVTQEYDRGIVGQPLALAIADRYNTYGIQDVNVASPPVMTLVERREFLPTVVTTRFQAADPLALIAMPLAVAAVADLVNVPRTDLMQFVTSLNQAMVPAPQFVEIVRYSPVVLVDPNASPQFLQFVTTEVNRGVVGQPLALSIANRLGTIEPIDIDVVRPRLIRDRDEILPPVVRTRVASSNPHGGPPGQIKKELGLQTGAEVVHGTMPGQRHKEKSIAVTEHRERPRHVRVEQARPVKPPHVAKPKPVKPVAPPAIKQHGGDHPHGNAGGGKGHGKGKGKG